MRTCKNGHRVLGVGGGDCYICYLDKRDGNTLPTGYFEEEGPALTSAQRTAMAVKVLGGEIPPQPTGLEFLIPFPQHPGIGDTFGAPTVTIPKDVLEASRDAEGAFIQNMEKEFKRAAGAKRYEDELASLIKCSGMSKSDEDRLRNKMAEIKRTLAPFKERAASEASERRTGLLKMIDRQAAMFSEAGPLTVKSEREKLHALVNEYASLK